MGCNCKSQNIDDILNVDRPKLNIGELIGKYSLKILLFSLMIIMLPLINLAIIWFMFNTLVLNRDVNIKPLLVALGNQFKEKKYEEDEEEIDEDEFNDLTEDDVIMVDVEDITNKSK
jgi:hypothetical protein